MLGGACGDNVNGVAAQGGGAWLVDARELLQQAVGATRYRAGLRLRMQANHDRHQAEEHLRGKILDMQRVPPMPSV